jgi:hypothetical protein
VRLCHDGYAAVAGPLSFVGIAAALIGYRRLTN